MSYVNPCAVVQFTVELIRSHTATPSVLLTGKRLAVQHLTEQYFRLRLPLSLKFPPQWAQTAESGLFAL